MTADAPKRDASPSCGRPMGCHRNHCISPLGRARVAAIRAVDRESWSIVWPRDPAATDGVTTVDTAATAAAMTAARIDVLAFMGALLEDPTASCGRFPEGGSGR